MLQLITKKKQKQMFAGIFEKAAAKQTTTQSEVKSTDEKKETGTSS